MTRSERQLHHRPAPEAPKSGTARIAVDLLGGDHAPAVVVDGALLASSADPELHLILVGPRTAADEVIGALPPGDRARVTVRAVDHVVGMADPPLRGVRHDMSVRAAAEAVVDGHADAMVSAGASGAAVTAAVHALGRLREVRRPALAATVPALAGPVVLLDLGVGVDLNAGLLAQHAVLGAAYARVVHDLPEPRVALLANAAEPGKGDRARRAAAALLADRDVRLPPGAVYAGTVEGHDVPLGGPADVVVTDGFTGNVLLKGMEAAYALATGDIDRLPEHPDLAGLRRHAAQLSLSVPRAATLLGVAGTVVICHGSATGADIASGIALAARLHRTGAIARVAETVSVAAGSSKAKVTK